MDAHAKASILGLGLVMLTQVIALAVLHWRSGGRMPGHLERSAALKLPQAKLDDFMAQFHERLRELGFQRGGDELEFLQYDPPMGDLGAFPHSQKKKKLTARFDEVNAETVSASFTVRYEEFIVVDTGETAYAAELLNFVSGQAETMRKVPNQSLTAWNSFLGGLLACAMAGILIATRDRMLWVAIGILGVTEFAVGLAALGGMWLKPGEVVGCGKAVIGIILSLLAVAASIAWIVTSRVEPIP
jgi:hypothetical protein